LPHSLRIAAIPFTEALARPTFCVKPDGFVESFDGDAALPNRNPRTTQMLGDGGPVQPPTLGQLEHAVAAFVLGNQFLGLS
jgi:hypothetical protein